MTLTKCRRAMGWATGSPHHRSSRTRGYVPIRDHAAIGDGRTVAFVAVDGTIDWLCLPDLDSPSVFGRLLDASDGGEFTLAPEGPFDSDQSYIAATNVVQTTFRTDDGSVRVTDAMTLPDGGLEPGRELCRRIEVLSGSVPMRWTVRPRFGYGQERTSLRLDGAVAIASSGNLAIAVQAWGAGSPALVSDRIEGRFVAEADALIVMTAAVQEPLVLPGRADVERRLRSTIGFWRDWAATCTYRGRWKDAVERSILALKLLVFSPSGAVAGAPTTSLPETPGGERNWDYRFAWIRDSAFTLSAFLRLGYGGEAEAFFWWLLHASQLTHPRLDVLYRLDGGTGAPERQLPLAGYEGARPVRVGNAAARQVQLDIYGDLLQTAWEYAASGRRFDREIGRRLAAIADFVCTVWTEPDAGIWEVRSEPRHFTHSKMMCWVALDRALALAEAGTLHGDTRRWRRERARIESFVESRCWSDEKKSYVRAAGTEELDAAVLLGALFRYREPEEPRMVSTIAAIERELTRGPFVYRYAADDGLSGVEGAFLPCSFWLVEALARSGQPERAAHAMAELVSSANAGGLYAEEIDPDDMTFLGNFHQGLTHLALIGASLALEEASG